MSAPLPQYVADTDVIIDLDSGGLLELLVELPFRLVVANIVVDEELLRPRREDLLEAGYVEAKDLSWEDQDAIQALSSRHPRPSFNDLAALHVAIQLKAPLLTRDKPLIRAAQRYGVDILDTFWLLEQMLEHDLLQPAQIILAVARMEARGNFLPQDELRQLLARWGHSEDRG